MFRLLGPVRLEVDGGDVDLGPGKQRGLLASLLLTPARSVPTAVLIDRPWGDAPPQQARNVLATYATRLRRALAPATPVGVAEAAAPVLARLHYATGGYLIDCDPESVDLHRVRRLVRESRAARQDGDPARASEILGLALAGWQPVPLAGIPGEWAARMRKGLQAERLDLRRSGTVGGGVELLCQCPGGYRGAARLRAVTPVAGSAPADPPRRPDADPALDGGAPGRTGTRAAPSTCPGGPEPATRGRVRLYRPRGGAGRARRRPDRR
jgi:hypothetical protein